MLKMNFVFCFFGIAIATGSTAHAEIFRCYFTEPFVTIKYDSSTRYLVTNSLAEASESGDGSLLPHPRFQMDVTMTTTVDGTITWLDSQGVTLFTLVPSNGSDGMSDVVFPYEITANSSQSLPKDYLGGCESESKPAIREK